MYIYISLQGLVWGKGRVKNNLVVLQHIARPLRRELIVTLCFHQKCGRSGLVGTKSLLARCGPMTSCGSP